MEDALAVDRLHFAFTVTFHYIFPQLTMGLALLLLILKTMALRTNDERWHHAARFWARIFGISFALGTSMPHVPISRLVGGNAEIPDVTRRSVWLKGSAWHVPDYDNAEAFVRRMVREGIVDCDPIVPAVPPQLRER